MPKRKTNSDPVAQCHTVSQTWEQREPQIYAWHWESANIVCNRRVKCAPLTLPRQKAKERKALKRKKVHSNTEQHMSEQRKLSFHFQKWTAWKRMRCRRWIVTVARLQRSPVAETRLEKKKEKKYSGKKRTDNKEDEWKIKRQLLQGNDDEICITYKNNQEHRGGNCYPASQKSRWRDHALHYQFLYPLWPRLLQYYQ